MQDYVVKLYKLLSNTETVTEKLFSKVSGDIISNKHIFQSSKSKWGNILQPTCSIHFNLSEKTQWRLIYALLSRYLFDYFSKSVHTIEIWNKTAETFHNCFDVLFNRAGTIT